MLRLSREDIILKALREKSPVSVLELVARSGASQASIRRDLVRLEEQGRLRRTYGGAVLEDGTDQPFQEVLEVNAAAKQRVAQAAAATVKDGQIIILDVGTTMLFLARALKGRPVTVITASIPVFEELSDDPAIEMILLGGRYAAEYRCMVGYLAEDSLRNLSADRAFISASGIAENGSIRETTPVQVPIKRAMLAAAAESTLLVDSSKFPGIGSARVGGLDAVAQIVTDKPVPPAYLPLLTNSQTKVTIA